MNVEDKRDLSCKTCIWYLRIHATGGNICHNPDGKYSGAWVSDHHYCECHKWREDS